MSIFLNFGEKVNGFDHRVINEREARASAGIMCLLGGMSLFSVYVDRTIFWAELYSITIILEFTIRVLINPTYAPYMLLGGFFTRNQSPDWVEAKQKHFAWALGLTLGIVMTYYIVNDLVSLQRMVICWICLALMFIESAFGICLGCILYQKLNWKTYNCPGDVCEINELYDKKKYLFIIFFFLLFSGLYFMLGEFRIQNLPPEIIILE